ncbi:MAG: nitronate monooxygenase [Gammaproteobacteria bacterium]|jgi:nitronate monooxygenase
MRPNNALVEHFIERLPERGAITIDKDINPNTPRRWKDVWSAGHTAEQIADILPVTDLVARLAREYHAFVANPR